jgi:hypothetical protein
LGNLQHQKQPQVSEAWPPLAPRHATGGRAQRPRPLLHVRLMRLPEMPDIYIEKSPLLRMHTMKTPTLIMLGTRDTSVPTEQGW